MSETTTLPDVTKQELMIILAALDELPGKVSRVLFCRIAAHVEAVKNPPEDPSAGA